MALRGTRRENKPGIPGRILGKDELGADG
jgi:hypothetical protein